MIKVAWHCFPRWILPRTGGGRMWGSTDSRTHGPWIIWRVAVAGGRALVCNGPDPGGGRTELLA